jgi:hypothetical protein
VNLSVLEVGSVHWILKQAVRVFLAQKIAPFAAYARYGDELYRAVGATGAVPWQCDLTPGQWAWVNAARALAAGAQRAS